jgi:hypothetical protein
VKICVIRKALMFVYKLQSILIVTSDSLITLIFFKLGYCDLISGING